MRMPQVPPQPPPSVLTAVKLMHLGAGLSALGIIVGILGRSAVRAAAEKAQPPYTASQVHTLVSVTVAASVVLGLIAVGLWIWMAYANKAGKSWARITSSLLFGFSILDLVTQAMGTAPALNKIILVLISLAGFAAIIFLWKSDSSAYFERRR
jgi:hypothetical protein